MSTAVDAQTAARLRQEFEHIKSAMQGNNATSVPDPLGVDGEVAVHLNVWKHTGAGEVVLRKGQPSGDHRYTRFRSWGPNGTDYIEKTSFLKKANGHDDFHKKRVEPGDQVTSWAHPEGEDEGWMNSLA